MATFDDRKHLWDKEDQREINEAFIENQASGQRRKIAPVVDDPPGDGSAES